MSGLLLDTHAWVWFVQNSQLLPFSVKRRIETAGQVFVSCVSVYEIGQKLRLGKWPGMSEAILDAMIGDDESGIEQAPLNSDLARTASLLAWDHRDPFDRMIAATAMASDLELVSKDEAFDQLETLWRYWS